MIVKQLYLKNFRGFSEVTIPFNDNLNVIIGKNDIGKSTILEALAIFFETYPVEIEDLKVGSSPTMTIGVVFEVDPTKEYLINTDRKTSLKDEYLLNSDGFLEIPRCCTIASCSIKKPCSQRKTETKIVNCGI